MSMVASAALAPLTMTIVAIAASAVLAASFRGFAALWRALDAELADARAARVNVTITSRPTGAWMAGHGRHLGASGLLSGGSLALPSGFQTAAFSRQQDFGPAPCGRAAA